MKKVWWIPASARTAFDDSISLTHDQFLMMDFGRIYFNRENKRIRKEGLPRCELCAHEFRLELHHKIPLWACTLRFLCDHVLAHGKILVDALRDFRHTPLSFAQWNGKENLAVLCKFHHDEAEHLAYAQWKTALSRMYYPHLVIGGEEYRNKQFGVVQKFYHEQRKAPL